MPHKQPLVRTMKIQVADLRSDPPEEVFPTSTFDGIMPRLNNPVTLVYSLDDAVDADTVVSNMCVGLQKTMSEYRFMAGSEHEGSQGRSYTKRSRSQAHFTVHVKDLRPTAYPSYAELASRHFPVSELQNTELLAPDFTPFPTMPSDGSGVPVTLVQLNLIRGGLVLGLVMNHRVVDARAMDNILARWAAHTRPLFSPTRAPPPALDPAALDRTPLIFDPASVSPPADWRAPPVSSMRYVPDGAPAGPGLSEDQMTSQIWHFPASKLAALKALAFTPSPPPTATTATTRLVDDQWSSAGADVGWVSTNDCLTALMWRCIVRSRLALHGLAADAVANDARPISLMNAVDVRPYVPTSMGNSNNNNDKPATTADPAATPTSSTSSFLSSASAASGDGAVGVPTAYAGNCVVFSLTTVPLGGLVGGGLQPAVRGGARALRATIDRYRAPGTLRAAAAWVEACLRGRGPGSVAMNVDPWRGLDVVATSWRALRGAYDRADFFGAGGAAALRWASPLLDGYCFLYPTRTGAGTGPDEGVEVYLGMEKGCMERLRADPELAAWAEVRGG